MRSPRLLLTAFLVLASVVVPVGCSGSDDGGEEVDKEDYAAQLSAIAESATESVDQLAAKIGNAGSLKGAGELLATFSERVDDLAARVEDVNPPDAVADLQARLVSLLEQLAEKTSVVASALKAGDLLGGLPKLTKVANETAEIAQQVDSTVDQIKGKLGLDSGD
jgi:hypothetical protein